MDIEGLSTLAKVLSEHVAILDILSLHVPMAELLEESLAFVEDYDFDAVGRWLDMKHHLVLILMRCVQVILNGR